MTLDDLKARMIEALEDWQETVDPCEHGHVEHTAAAHLGRRLVHSRSQHGFGADWDYDDAVAYIQSALTIFPELMQMGHVPVRGADGRVIAFAVKRKRVGGDSPTDALMAAR